MLVLFFAMYDAYGAIVECAGKEVVCSAIFEVKFLAQHFW